MTSPLLSGGTLEKTTVSPRISNLIAGLVTLVASACSRDPASAQQNAQAPAAEELPLYYNVSNRADRLSLVSLADMEERGSKVIVRVTSVDLDPKAGMGLVWELDCDRERMTLVQAAQLAPDYVGNLVTLDAPTSVSARGSAETLEIYQLGCEGEAQLDRRRVITTSENYDLASIVEDFWAGQ